MKDFLKSIGITQTGYFNNDKNYIIDIESSDEFNRIFSKLNNNDALEENEDSSVVNLNVSNILYLSEEYSLNLIADFNQNIYKLVVTDLKEN